MCMCKCVCDILILKIINGETTKIFLSKSVEYSSTYITQREARIPESSQNKCYPYTPFFLWKFWEWNQDLMHARHAFYQEALTQPAIFF